MGNKIITEKDFWICTLGNVPAQLQGTREGSKKKSGEKYITVEDKATSSWIDFGCKKYMLLMAIVAAVLVVGAVVLGVVTVATGGAALIAIGALAGLAGAAIGAVMGGLLCGQKMGGGRKWLGSKKDLIIQGSPGITGGHQMECKAGGVITFAPHIKSWSQAVSLGAANYIGGLMEGMMAGAAIGMGGAALSGGASAFASAGWRGLGRAALNFGKSIPTNLKVNFIESLSKFGLGLRGVMGVQNTAATYGNTGEASVTDFAKGTVAMETSAYDSAKNIATGQGTWQDWVGMAMMIAPVGQGKRELEDSLFNKEAEEKAKDAETTKDGDNETAKVKSQEGEAPAQTREAEAFEHSTGGKTPFDTIAEDGYRGGLDHIEAGTRTIDEASFTPENIEAVKEHLSKDQISNNGELWENNKTMIDRLEAIQRGELEATATDKAFLTHEMREAELMNQGMTYKEAHAQTCKEYGITAEMERGANGEHPFYTKEAEDALYKADIERLGF